MDELENIFLIKKKFFNLEILFMFHDIFLLI